jgi:hypothetical protein
LTQYKQVLARPNVYDAHDEAKKGLQKPYKPSRLYGPTQQVTFNHQRINKRLVGQ